MYKEYKIISYSSKFELEIKVSEYVKKGWIPTGGVSFNKNTGELMQAIVRTATTILSIAPE